MDKLEQYRTTIKQILSKQAEYETSQYRFGNDSCIGRQQWKLSDHVCRVAQFYAIGAIVNRQGQVVRGHVDAKTGRRHHSIDDLERRLANPEGLNPPQGNTTLTVVVTNQKVETRSLKQLAKQVHTSMGRAIQPFQTIFDGDTLYAVTTNEVENPALPEIALGVVASEVVWDAVLSIADIK